MIKNLNFEKIMVDGNVQKSQFLRIFAKKYEMLKIGLFSMESEFDGKKCPFWINKRDFLMKMYIFEESAYILSLHMYISKMIFYVIDYINCGTVSI